MADALTKASMRCGAFQAVKGPKGLSKAHGSCLLEAASVLRRAHGVFNQPILHLKARANKAHRMLTLPCPKAHAQDPRDHVVQARLRYCVQILLREIDLLAGHG